MIDHLKLFVADPAASRAFYERALEPLGYRVLLEPAPGVVGMGADRPDFWLAAADGPTTTCHVAFRADREQQVAALPRRRARRRRHRQRRARPAAALPPELLRRLRARPRRQQRRGRLPRRDAALGRLRPPSVGSIATTRRPWPGERWKRGVPDMMRSMSSRSSTSFSSSSRASSSSWSRWSRISFDAPRIASSDRCCCSSSRSSRVRSETSPPSGETRRDVIVVPIA